MKIKKSISFTIHIPPRDTTQPLTVDERKQLTEFFLALADLHEDKNVTKGNMYAELYKRHSDNTH
ncbi:MAG: hypothetical protein K2X90_00230 [Candidatus Babeliaceae bacterium]|nr:hypothetical protein [Candidatus Babeliaceae bacterium]